MKHAKFFVSTVFVIFFIQGCAVQKELVPTGGSRADGTVKLSFEYGLFEAPKLDEKQGMSAAQKRCSAWGYTGAEPFGGSTKTCIESSNSGCTRWLVSIEYQCTGTSSASK